MYTPNNVHVNQLHGSLQLTALKNKKRECTPDSAEQQFQTTESEPALSPGGWWRNRRLVTAPRGQPSIDATGKPNQFSYYVQLRHRTFQSTGFICGAVLIGPRTAITAGHCVEGVWGLYVRMGMSYYVEYS